MRHFSRAVDWVGRSELVFIVGTALQDAPARQLPGVAEANGATVVWVNEAAEDILPLFCQTPAQDG
ncbi:hypothetical protein GCM10025857_38430 [Alicyclobacillus contaminans]|nr:hypothetical protein GCM10025857_38430 [Alicyclobacillus contaminans]